MKQDTSSKETVRSSIPAEAVRLCAPLASWSGKGFLDGFVSVSGFAAIDWTRPERRQPDLPSDRLWREIAEHANSPSKDRSSYFAAARRNLALLHELHRVERGLLYRRHVRERTGQTASLVACLSALVGAVAFSIVGNETLAMGAVALFAGMVLASSFAAAGR